MRIQAWGLDSKGVIRLRKLAQVFISSSWTRQASVFLP